MPNWDLIKKEWETSNITLKDLAEKHGVKLGTLKSRKSHEKWSRDATKKDAAKTKGLQPKVGAPKGNKNAVGNKGNPNPKNQFTERNTMALKHGLFSRYIPKETLEIMGMLDEKDPADLLWDQIMIQYAAIIRAQSIMFVTDKNEMIKELKKEKETENSSEIEYEFQFAWDRQANFLNAQSRAIAELRSSIKQFLELAHEQDERRLKLEKMQLNIEKTKAELDKLNDDSNDKPIEIVIKRKGENE
ncbi:phage terminase small subunit [Caldifermentibacillus hisashii]|uniref:Phage terminase small subunit n=1 Tax=Caldifermentibacillus hisashii TaxID=996558 RepID=A0ABU9K3D8_9BACI